MTWKLHISSKIYLPAFFVFFLLATGWAKGQGVSSSSTIIDRLDKKLWVSVPAEFGAKLLDFVLNDTIMRTRSATAYTEEFIIKEMEKDWWISKQHQLLFIWSKIYGWISQKKLYNRLDDENSERAWEYKKSLKQIASCYEAYKKWFKTYMESVSTEARQQSAEYDRQSAEYDRQSAEAIKKIMQQDSIWIKERMVEFYEIYIKNPSTVKKEDINFAKKSTETIVSDCKKYWIDYRAILLKEVWDMKKVDAILKFYGVE